MDAIVPAAAPLTTPQEVKHSRDTPPAGESSAAEADAASQQIQAYAMLDFDSFTFYVQTMQIILGRMVDGEDALDIHLGSQKAISRRHAKIFYNFGNQRFELSVLGRNGAFVDDAFVEKGVTVPLHHGSKVQIGETGFIFDLPGGKKKKLKNPNPTSSKDKPLSMAVPVKNKKRLPSITEADILALKSLDSVKASVNPTPQQRDMDIDIEIQKVLADHDMHDDIPHPMNMVAEEDEEEDKDLKFDKDLAAALQENSKKNAPPPKKSQLNSNGTKRTPKKKKIVYSIDEIPPQYREKPPLSYSNLITECLRKRSTPRGMSLSEIYKAIQDIYPYYFYAPDGWQSSVRHNLSLNKSFRKISKEGKGWLWGLNEEVIAEKERQKEKQIETAKAKFKNIQAQQIAKANQRVISKDESGIPSSSTSTLNIKQQNPGQQHQQRQQMQGSQSVNDNTKRALAYLQKELIQLTKNRYNNFDKVTTTEILTQALAMTINQVGQAAKSAGIKGSPLVTLIDKNPQHITKILTAALNAATLQITRKKGLPTVPKPAQPTQQQQQQVQQQPQTFSQQQPLQQPPQQQIAQGQQQLPQQQPSSSQTHENMAQPNAQNISGPSSSAAPILTTKPMIAPKPDLKMNPNLIKPNVPQPTSGPKVNKPMIHTFTKPMQFTKPLNSVPMKIKPIKPPQPLSKSQSPSSSSATLQAKPPQPPIAGVTNSSTDPVKPTFYSKSRPAKPQSEQSTPQTQQPLEPQPQQSQPQGEVPASSSNVSGVDNQSEIKNEAPSDTANEGPSGGGDISKMLDSFISDNSNALKRPLDEPNESAHKVLKTE